MVALTFARHIVQNETPRVLTRITDFLCMIMAILMIQHKEIIVMYLPQHRTLSIHPNHFGIQNPKVLPQVPFEV